MYRLTRLGEFKNRDLERKYLIDTWTSKSVRLQFTVLITAILYLLAIVADFMQIGFGQQLNIMLAGRSFVSLIGLAVFLIYFLDKGSLDFKCNAVTIYMSALFLCESLELWVKGQIINGMSVPGTVFIALAYYIFLPPKSSNSLTAAIGGSIVYILTLVLLTTAPMDSVFNITLYMILANGFGLYALIQSNKSKRNNFALLARLREMAETDSLTQALSRRRLLEVGERLFRYAQKFRTPFSLLILDIDDFKLVNDSYGHHAGDFVLAEIANRCKEAIRGVDAFGRYGGEEFVIVLPHSDLSQAMGVAERIRKSVHEQPFEFEEECLTVTVSLGAAQITPQSESIKDIIRNADQGLYKAKAGGKNRTCLIQFDNDKLSPSLIA